MIRIPLFACFFLVSGLATTSLAWADAAGEALVREALNAITAAPGWTATSDVVRSEGDRVIVEGLSISSSDGMTSVTAQTVELTGLANRDRGYFAAGASVRNLSVSYDLSSMVKLDTADTARTSMGNIVRVENLVMTNLYLPAQTGAADGAARDGLFVQLIAFYSYLARVEMTSMEIPVMVNEQTISLPDLDQTQTSRVTYYDSRISDWSNGVIARYDLGRMEMEMAGGEAGDIAISADRAFAEHMDIAHMAHVMDPANYAGGRGDGVWRALLRKAEYAGLRVNAGDVEASIARLSISDFDMRQPEKPFLAILDSAIASGLAGEEPDEEQVIEMMGEMVPAIMGTFRIGDMRMEDLQVRPVVSSDPIRFSLEEIRITDYSGEGIELFLMSGLSGTGPGVEFGLESLRFDRIGFPKWESFKVLMEFAMEAEKNPDNPEIPPDMARQMMDIYPSVDTFLVQNLSGNAPGQEPFGIEEIRIEVTSRAMGFMVGGHGEVRGVVIPGSYFDQGAGPNPLALLNYDRLAMALDFRTDWDEAQADVDSVTNLRVEDVGDLTVQYGLSGFTEQAVETMIQDAFALGASGQDEDIEKLIALFGDIGFKGFTLAFTDRSIIERALALVSSQQGSDTETYRNQLKAALPFFLSGMPPGEFRQQLIEAAQATLDGGQTTTLSLAPAQPVKVPEIVAVGSQDPLSLVDLLGASVVSKPAN